MEVPVYTFMSMTEAWIKRTNAKVCNMDPGIWGPKTAFSIAFVNLGFSGKHHKIVQPLFS